MSQETVIEPRRGSGEKPVPPALLMGFTAQDLALFRRALGMGDAPARSLDFSTVWECPAPWNRVALAGPAMGAPSAVYLMERLIALGAGYIISVGSCGSLQPDVPIGQILLPTGALVEEGTSAHYRGAGVKTAPDPTLFGTIRDRLCAEGISPLEGRVWTTDAPFRETIDKVCAFQKAGILGVDMESSALMTVASFRGIPFASVLVVSDELASLSWECGFKDASYRERLVKAAETSVGVLAEKVTEEMQERRDGKA